MTLPGPVITSRETPPRRSAPTAVDRWFVCGLVEKGALEPIEITSMADYKAKLGDRVTYGILHDALEAFFAEGGNRAVVSRVVGPAAAAATANIFDQSGSVVPGDVALVVTATSPGEWGNALNVEVTVQATNFTIIVSHDTLGVLETSPELADRDAALAWAANNLYIDLALGASAEDPRAQGPTSLASGTDDRASITDAHWLIALNRFAKDLGPGQLSYPGRTTTTAHGQLLDHARANNRVALLDLADVASAATLRTAALALRGDPDDRYAAAFAPWAVIPGLTLGTTRLVPYSAIQAGLEARPEPLRRTVNQAAAGKFGLSNYAIGLSQPAWSDPDRELLNDAGVNVARVMFGGVRTYGFRTLVDPLGARRDWILYPNARLNMHIAALANEIAEDFEFRQIDGAKHTISEYNLALAGMLLEFYDVDALFGETFDDAAIVDTGDAVNTPATIAAHELRAVLAVRMSDGAERVLIEIAKVPTTQALA